MNCPGHCLMFKHRVRSYRGNFDLHRHISSNDIFCIRTWRGWAAPQFIVETCYQYNAPVWASWLLTVNWWEIAQGGRLLISCIFYIKSFWHKIVLACIARFFQSTMSQNWTGSELKIITGVIRGGGNLVSIL